MSAKFQKLDPKQVPQTIGLVVVCLGVFGYAGYTLVQMNKPVRASDAANPAATARPATAAATLSPGAAPDGAKGPDGVPAPGADPAGAEAAKLAALGPQLPAVNNADPFKPAFVPKSDVTAAVKPAGPRSRGVRMAQGGFPGGFELPPAFPGGAPGTGAPEVSVPAVPAGPTRPDIAVTGVINAEDGKNMALVDVGTEHRIVQVGDVLPNSYKVKRIGLDGLLLVNGKDRYFVVVGNKSQAGAAPVAAPAAVPVSVQVKPGV